VDALLGALIVARGSDLLTYEHRRRFAVAGVDGW
jgi:hypothetical protein